MITINLRRVALFLIVGGILLYLLPTTIISLLDIRKGHLQKEEAKEWIERKELEESKAKPITAVSEDLEPPAMVVITPGEEGYLLEIPKIDLRLAIRELEPEVFSGKNTPMLKKYAVGQVPYTEYLKNVSPGDEGTTVIAGHRTTFGGPLRNIDLLEPGDEIVISQEEIQQKWEVMYTIKVVPDQIDAIRSSPGIKRLALLACNPPFSDYERIIVYAKLKGGE